MTKSTRPKVIYLSLGAPHLEYPEVAQALHAKGIEAQMVHLNAVDTVDWTGVDLVNIRMCRWYHKTPTFLAQIERLHARLRQMPGGPVPMANNIGLIRDAVDKALYLRKLSEDGVEVIPTRWIDRGSQLRIAELMEQTGWDDVVVKPTISSGSWNTIRISRHSPRTSESHFLLQTGAAQAQYDKQAAQLLATHDLCVQRFLPSVLAFGEISFVFLGGQLSHTVRKTVGDNGWWAHERLGGRNHLWNPQPQEVAWAQHIYEALVRRYGKLWFGRIDGLYDEDGQLRLLECELAIPRLLLPEGRAFNRYAQVIADGLERGRPRKSGSTDHSYSTVSMPGPPAMAAPLI